MTDVARMTVRLELEIRCPARFLIAQSFGLKWDEEPIVGSRFLYPVREFADGKSVMLNLDNQSAEMAGAILDTHPETSGKIARANI